MPLHEQIFAASCLLVCFSALILGGAPERIIACSFLAAYAATHLLRSPDLMRYASLEWRIAIVDVILLCVVGLVGCSSTRYWGIPMGSMQLLDVLGHAARMLDADVLPQAYFAVVSLISFPMVLLLAVGILNHRLRLRRFGHDPSWVRQLPASYRAGWPLDHSTSEDS